MVATIAEVRAATARWRELALTHRLEALETRVSQERAASIEGGLYQVLVLAQLRGELDLVAAEWGQEGSVAPLLRRMDGCLYSLVALLAEAAGLEPAAVAADWYLNPRCDPHGDGRRG